MPRRQQLSVLQRKVRGRVQFTNSDRLYACWPFFGGHSKSKRGAVLLHAPRPLPDARNSSFMAAFYRQEEKSGRSVGRIEFYIHDPIK